MRRVFGPMGSLNRVLATPIIALGLTFGGALRAQPELPVPDPSSTTAAPSLCVSLDNGSTEVSEEEFLRAIGERFAQPGVPSKCTPATPAPRRVSVVYAPENAELTVSYSAETGGALTRVLEAPANPSEAPTAAAQVALELSQREAPEEATKQQEVAPQVVPVEHSVPAENSPAPPGDTTGPKRPRRIATAAFLYPLATNFDQPDVHTSLDFNLLYGVVGEVEGFQLGTVNDVRGSVQGLQLGLLINGVHGPMRGLSVAGLVGSAGRVNAGLQAAGLLTLSQGTTDGIQVATLGNLSRASVRGAQLSGVLNYAGGESKGLQASFVTNFARNIRGAQVSLLGNYAENVNGLQIGLLNIGNRVRGTQIGLVNIAKEIEGVPIGLVSVSKSGGVHLSAWASNTNLGNLGLRLATRHTYSMFTLGYDRESATNLFGPGFIFGVRAPVATQFAVDIDVGGDYLLGTRLCCFVSKREERRAHVIDRSHFRLRAIPTWQPRQNFSVFAGAGLAVRVPFAVYSNFEEADRSVTLGPEVLFGVSL